MHSFDYLQEKKPLVSVLLASYYSGESLFQAVKSVLAQDYENLELLICDDGTEDFPEERLHELLRTDSVISYTLLHQQINVGTVRNLNRGLEQAKGTWIMPMAADDVLAETNAISSMMTQVTSSGKRWIIPKTALCDKNLTQVFALVPEAETERQIRNGAADMLYEQMCFHCCFPSSGVLYQRNLLEKLDGFDEQYRLVEDWPLFLKLLRQKTLPDISAEVFVRHRGDGVSGKRAGKNECYQQDLITVMEQEILPHFSCIADEKQQKQLLQQIQDKKAIFEYRFHCGSTGQRLAWFVRNTSVLFRKIIKNMQR